MGSNTYICHEDVAEKLQRTIYFLLKENPNVCSYVQVGDNKYNIYDGEPTSIGRIGFPYVIVHTPTVSETPLTIKKRNVTATMKIEIIDKKEANVRELSDVIRGALYKEAIRTRKCGFWNLLITSTNLSSRYLPNETSKPVWVYILFVRYVWRGFTYD